jgi:hypothetical protein
VICLLFVSVSLLDIVIAFFYARFYSNAAFIVTFGVGGILAASFGYVVGINYSVKKNEAARWTLIATMIFSGLILFFLLSRLEGGEYEAPFKAFGATLALGSLLFVKGKVE